ncbi:hypothetical protein B0H16DRAFT_708690 [Mycena metata]|uniref:F-box domain-containing protein n=1 Tax=Mycena metata TaxID=1033252 RepID=A0AAD7J3I4_9AGAR|nr:hypothetical protein B0H16DRAFT_708690 [Mycena metata]
MSFSLLPNELVLVILASIPPSGIEAFTLIDTRCHALSPRAHRAPQAQTPRRLPCTPFPPLSYPKKATKDLIEKGLVEKGMLPNLEYLQLNGDLHWLRAQTPEVAAEHDGWPRGRAASPETVRKLMADSQSLGLTLPAGFATFIGSQALIERLHLGGNTIELGELFQCTLQQDGGKGGHVVRFMCDQQGCGYWGLYMDTAGHSCVVHAESWDDFFCGCCEAGRYAAYAHPPVAHEAIVEAAASLRFVCVDAEWEEWMANMYFDGWIWGALWAEREVVGWDLEYVRHFERQKDTVFGGGHEKADRFE